jgi:hypothetical protein
VEKNDAGSFFAVFAHIVGYRGNAFENGFALGRIGELYAVLLLKKNYKLQSVD